MKIVAISGSLRQDSWNTRVLHALAAMAPDGVEIVKGDISGIPLYNGDLEAEGMPESVTALQDEIAAADGLLLISPEYNGGIPGVMKNAIDWLSRDGGMARVFKGKPTALCGASPGRGGTRTVQMSWLPVFRVLGVHFWGAGQLYLSAIHKSFDEQGTMDVTTAGFCEKFVHGFVAYIGLFDADV